MKGLFNGMSIVYFRSMVVYKPYDGRCSCAFIKLKKMLESISR